MAPAIDRFSDGTIIAIVRENIRSAIAMKGLTAQETAHLASLSGRKMERLLDSTSAMDVASLLRVCAFLSLSVEDLIRPSEDTAKNRVDFILRSNKNTIDKLSEFALYENLNANKET